MNTLIIPVLGALLAFAHTSQAADAEAGKSKAATVCASCHGINGVSASEGFPNLAGQKGAYLVSTLKAYREGQRKAAIMNNMALNLSDQEIENLAAYYSGIKPAP